MAFTASTPISEAYIVYSPVSQFESARVYSDEDPRQRLTIRSGYASVDATELAAVREHYANNDGFIDADGNAIEITFRNLLEVVADHTEIESKGYENPFIEGSADRLANLREVLGALMAHARVVTDADTGRRDIEIGGGLIPVLLVPESGEMQQRLEDWTASQVSGRLRVTIHPRSGETFLADDLITDDPRIEAMVRFLEEHQTAGAGLPLASIPVTTLAGLHALVNLRTYEIDQDTSAVTNNISISLSSSGVTPSQANLTFLVTDGTLSVSLMNALLGATTVGIPTDAPIEEPPFGATDVRLRTERVEFADAQLVSERKIPAWRIEGQSHPLGGSYGKSKRLSDLTLDAAGYYLIPWDDKEEVYDLRAIHVENVTDVDIRLGLPTEMALNSGSQFAFDIHNGNAHGGGLVNVQEEDGTGIITLLPREIFPVVAEWFDGGAGEIRSGRRIPRPLEVSADDKYAVLNDVGYWEDSSTHWARPVPFPEESEWATDLFYAADVFEFGTASIANGTAITASSFNLHVKESFKLLKVDGRFRYRMTALVRAKPGTSGSLFPNVRLWRQRGGVGNDPVTLVNIPHASLGSDDEQVWELVFEDEGEHIEVNDVFCPVVVTNKTASRNPSNVELVAFRLSAYLDEEIVLEYTA